MSANSNIEWTDTTWNVVRGCSRVSAGCQKCYAERQAIRQVNSGYAGLVRISEGADGKREPRWTGELRFVEQKIAEPLSWRAPRKVFVNSMSDLFHEKLSNAEIAEVFATMALAPQHTFQILTKRPARAKEWFAWAAAEWPKLHSLTAIQEMRQHGHGPDSNVVLTYARNERVLEALRRVEDDFAAPWPLPNVWLGVSVENQAAADERIPLLLETPAAVRFLSVEPLLGPVDLSPWLDQNHPNAGRVPCADCGVVDAVCDCEAGPVELDWVIVGGESGPGARPCDVAWIRSVVEQCKAAGVACFVKQLGAVSESRVPVVNGDRLRGHEVTPSGLRDRKGGDPDEWPLDLRVRQFPEVKHDRR